MKSDTEMLDEVMVVAFGTAKKSALDVYKRQVLYIVPLYIHLVRKEISL